MAKYQAKMIKSKCMSDETTAVAGSEVLPTPPLEVFSKGDFEEFSAPESRGGEKRVLLAKLKRDNSPVAIKLPRYDATRQREILTKRRQAYKGLVVTRPLSEAEQRQFVEDGFSQAEAEAERVIDWKRTLQDPRVREVWNSDVEDRLSMAQIAHRISPAVAEPMGVYKTKTGLSGEVYRAYEGKMAQNFSDPENFRPLSDAHYAYYESQVNLLRSYGFRGGEELHENNVMVIGDGESDIVFVEPPTTIDLSKIEKDDQLAAGLRAIGERYQERGQSSYIPF
jgi:hypothetical protein